MKELISDYCKKLRLGKSIATNYLEIEAKSHVKVSGEASSAGSREQKHCKKEPVPEAGEVRDGKELRGI